MNEPALGDKVREIVTGHEGTVTGQLEYLWGCRQYLVHYRNTEGKPETEWYDIARLEVLERSVVTPIEYPGFVAEASGPAAHRGPDVPPPSIA